MKTDYRDSSLSVEARVEDLLAQMTPKEKLGQLNQAWVWKKDPTPPIEALCRRIADGELGSVIATGAGLHNRFQRAARDSRLGIPVLVGYDIIHGGRTIFPISLALACSFDPDLFRRAQETAACEARADCVDWTFAPMCDLARDARWGRVSETCGEDPFLASLCAEAQVRGFQGDDPAGDGRIAACLKHFVGYSASVGGRDYDDTEITEWTLRNQHLPAFRAGIEAGALTVMSAFNAIGGIPSVANRHTLTEILRGEWGFPGFVVSDMNAVLRQIEWGTAADEAEAARQALAAGNEMDMVCETYARTLQRELEAGRLPTVVLDEAVRRILRVKLRLGLFERPSPPEAVEIIADPAAEALAYECAVRSVVLVKNDGILPLAASPGRIALIGPFGDDAREQVGSWDNYNAGDGAVTLAAALRERWGDAVTVTKGCAACPGPATRTRQDGVVEAVDTAQDDEEFSIGAAVESARSADVVVLALGEPSGWSGECATRANLGLTGQQQALFDAVAATGKPIVLILTCGRPLAVPKALARVQAVLFAWQLGRMAGPALLDLLAGDIAPTGRLSISIPRDAGQCPVFYNRMRSGNPGSRHYKDMSADAQFWFGYGLTYTTFAYDPVVIEPASANGLASATCGIRNKGARVGEELAQLYVRHLACSVAARPEQELRGFVRVRLAPGERRTVRFALTDEVLGFVDLCGRWRVEPGDYRIWIAPHAQTGDAGTYRHLLKEPVA
jgi:beta-glucosidase